MSPSYGTIIRTIRLNKGFSQKEIYSGIVSKSFAIEFEKGHHDMRMTLFLQVLDRLSITIQEFIFIENDYHHTMSSSYSQRFSNAYNEGDTGTLEQLVQELSQSKSDYYKVLHARIRLSLLDFHFHDDTDGKTLTQEHPIYPEKEVKLIQQYLTRLDSWTMDEIVLFTNTLTIFPFDTQCTLMKIATRGLDKYKEHRDYSSVYSSLLVNFLGYCLQEKELGLSRYYLDLLEVHSRDVFEASNRIAYLYYEGIYLILTGDKEKGAEQATKMSHLYQRLGYTKMYVTTKFSLQEFLT